MFSGLVAHSGYWQNRIDEGDRDKTPFLSNYDLQRSTPVPFDHTNALSTFQRSVDVGLSFAK